MTTAWQTESETDELAGSSESTLSLSPTSSISARATGWDDLTIPERVAMAQNAGFSGQLGSKPWSDLTPGEKTTVLHPEERPALQEYQVKAHVVLEDSSNQVWGLQEHMN